MAFRYNLQSVLHLRQGLERQEEQRLLACALVVARIHTEIEHLDEHHLAQRRTAMEELKSGSCGSVVQFLAVCEKAYMDARARLLRDLNDAEQKRLVQMQIYKEARRGREVLDGLRERQKAAYDLEITRRDQQQADEAHLLRGFFEARDQELTEKSF